MWGVPWPDDRAYKRNSWLQRQIRWLVRWCSCYHTRNCCSPNSFSDRGSYFKDLWEVWGTVIRCSEAKLVKFGIFVLQANWKVDKQKTQYYNKRMWPMQSRINESEPIHTHTHVKLHATIYTNSYHILTTIIYNLWGFRLHLNSKMV